MTCALSVLRIPPTGSEYQMHEWIAAALRSGGFVVEHEVALAPRCRIDFLAEGIGVEVKRGKHPRTALLKQCDRYMASQKIEALVLVTDVAASLPGSLHGKPLVVFGLNRLWGVALP